MIKKRVRVLIVHSMLSRLGDKIRTSKVQLFLRKKGFEVSEKRINTRNWMAFAYGLKHPSRAWMDRMKIGSTRTRSFQEMLAISLLGLIQQEILEEATKIKPHAIVAEGSLLGYLCLMAKSKLNVPLVTDVHGLIGIESQLGGSRYAQMISNAEKIALHESDYILTVSVPMKREICSMQKVQADKVFVVPNGGDVHQFRAFFDLPLNVIYAGNLAPYERVSDYLEIAKAVGRTPLFVFSLMGEGAQRREIVSRINNEKIPIRFRGLKTRQEALQIISKMQVGVVTSTSGLERVVAFPIKVLDYMSCGLPVVAPKIGDWGELIARENCGIAIKENSTAEFVEALYALCNKGEWTKKSTNGKKCIEREYSWNLVLEPLAALVENIAS